MKWALKNPHVHPNFVSLCATTISITPTANCLTFLRQRPPSRKLNDGDDDGGHHEADDVHGRRRHRGRQERVADGLVVAKEAADRRIAVNVQEQNWKSVRSVKWLVGALTEL